MTSCIIVVSVVVGMNTTIVWSACAKKRNFFDDRLCRLAIHSLWQYLHTEATLSFVYINLKSITYNLCLLVVYILMIIISCLFTLLKSLLLLYFFICNELFVYISFFGHLFVYILITVSSLLAI